MNSAQLCCWGSVWRRVLCVCVVLCYNNECVSSNLHRRSEFPHHRQRPQGGIQIAPMVWGNSALPWRHSPGKLRSADWGELVSGVVRGQLTPVPRFPPGMFSIEQHRSSTRLTDDPYQVLCRRKFCVPFRVLSLSVHLMLVGECS